MHRKSDSELKARFSELERELASYQAGEQNQSRLEYFRKLVEEENLVERELYHRLPGCVYSMTRVSLNFI